MNDSSLAINSVALPLRAGLARVPGVAWILGLLLIGFSATSADFLTRGNLINVGQQSVILLMLAWMMVHQGSFALALAVALATGLAFGFVNGALVAWVKLPPFVVTLGTMGVAQGLALLVTDGQSIVGVGETVQSFYSGELAGIPLPLLLGAFSYALTHVLLYYTRFGTYIFALGGNPDALKLAGIRANAYLIAVYMFGGLMAGLAALLLTARMSSGHPTAAIGMEFDAIAAVVVGGTSLERGNGWLFGTLLGVIAVGVLRNGLNLLTIQSSAQVACIGMLVILALLIDSFKVKP